MTEISPSPKQAKRRKILIGVGLFFLLLVSLLFLGVAYENWSGAKEWKRVEEKLIRAGVELDPKALIPASPDPESNFVSEPLLQSLFEFREPEGGEEEVVYERPELVGQFRKLQLPKPTGGGEMFPNWQLRKPADFDVVVGLLEKEGEPLAALGDWLATMEPELGLIDAAAKRPNAVIPFDLADDFVGRMSGRFPYLNDLMNLQKLEVIRVCLALETGDTQAARDGIRTMTQISRASGSVPSLVGFLVHIATLQQTLGAIWHGQSQNLWVEEDYLWLESELANESSAVLQRLETSFNFELCVMGIGAFDYIKTQSAGSGVFAEYLNPGSFDRIIHPSMILLPVGIWDHNKAFASEWMYDQGLGPVMRREYRPDASAVEEGFGNQKRSPRNYLAKIITPALTSVNQRGFEMAASLDLALVACAVERFQIREGKYPEKLADLVPSFLTAIPSDRMGKGGDRIRYHRIGNRYRLYSVGGNGTDEGARVEFRAPGGKKIDRNAGDLVWSFEGLDKGE